MDAPPTFAQLLTACRGPRSIAACAAALGVSWATAVAWLTGKTLPKQRDLSGISGATGIPLEQIQQAVAADRQAKQQADTVKVAAGDGPAAAADQVPATSSPATTAGESQRSACPSELLKPALEEAAKADAATAIAYAAADAAAAISATAAKNLATIASKVLGPAAARQLIDTAERAERHAVRSPASSPEAEG